MERDNVGRLIDFTGPVNDAARNTVIPGFRRPSDRHDPMPALTAFRATE